MGRQGPYRNFLEEILNIKACLAKATVVIRSLLGMPTEALLRNTSQNACFKCVTPWSVRQVAKVRFPQAEGRGKGLKERVSQPLRI